MTLHPRQLLISLCLTLLLGGCGGTEYTYRDGRDQKEGTGLMSGEDGNFTIYNADDDAGKEESHPEKQQAERKDPQ